ncbi:MAG: hypothetical protein IJX25_04115 [Clostridia bacterium]|nr:hypothetical protein [Clostridia bacterium]
MAKSKKINILIFSLMLVLSSLLFVACGEIDYSQVSLSSSQDYIEVFVGEEENVTITIDNPVSNMSKLLSFSTSSNKCSVVETSHRDYSTTYTITGQEGGNASITFVALDGGASKTIDVLVRKYSETFSATDQLLFVTNQSDYRLIPSKTDFAFGENVSEKELEFYFYGLYNEGAKLTLEDVQEEDAFIKEFVSARLIEQGGKQYLIFEDELGNFYTLAKSTLYTSEKKLYFVTAGFIEGEGYDFSDAGANKKIYDVSSGEKFTFIARYQAKNAMGEEYELSAMKHFVIYDALSSVSHDVTYKDSERESSFDAERGEISSTIEVPMTNEDTVTFIPYYTPEVGSSTVDFLTAYVLVELEQYNPYIEMKYYSEDDTVVTGKLIGISENGKIYCFQLDCAQGNKASTNFVVQFYYEGLDSSTSELVNKQYKIPVDIRNIPNTLYLNNEEYLKDEKKTDTAYVFYNHFYNHYYGMAGWQAFNIQINPSNAEYSSFGLDLSGTGLTVKYKNVIYTEDDLESTGGILYISDLSQPVYLRGKEGATTTEEAYLPIIVGIDILESETLTYYLNYRIQQGATEISFIEGTKFEDNGIDIDLNVEGGQIEFSEYLFADADYQSFTVKHSGGEDIVKVSSAEKSSADGKYFINLIFKPLKTGKDAFYQIMLDNGETFEIKVNVIETLGSISVETSNENNLIKQQSGIDNTYYVYNGNVQDTKLLDFYVYSNGDKNSNAIDGANILLTDSSVFALYNQTADGCEFDLQVLQNGALVSSIDGTTPTGLVVEAKGYTIKDFVADEVSLYCPITLYSYSYIDSLTTISSAEGISANYVSVYTNVKNEDLRSVEFEFDVKGDGFVFYSHEEGKYEAEAFSNKYIYWEISSRSTESAILTFNQGSLSIGEGSFIIDSSTGKLTFIANSDDLDGTEEIYLLTHVRQFAKVFTFTTRIQIKNYVPVDEISMQEAVNSISLSILNKQTSLVAIPVLNTIEASATNPQITCEVTTEVSSLKGIFEKSSNFGMSTDKWNNELNIIYDKGTGKTYISLSISDTFVEEIASKTEKLSAKLKIYAVDWLEQGNVAPDYQGKVLNITINFENGSENNRLSIGTVEDLKAVKSNLSAHYQVVGIIDATSVVSEMPFGQLSGSIVGTKDYSKISGLNFTDGSKAGLFTEIASGAYIKNLSFVGSFNWTVAPTETDNIGLIARVNNGTIENVGVSITTSSIALTKQNVGGVVGTNNGTISQNFSRYDKLTADGKENEDYDELYDYCSPKTLVYFNGTLNVLISGQVSQLGGLAGVNRGTIQKMAGAETYYGYTNYTSYSQIIVTTSASYSADVGGIAGKNEGTISGVLVGGLVSTYGNAGGIAGTSVASSTLKDLTTRTLVRSFSGAVALVAHTSSNSVSGISVEAVDDGRLGREASMAIAYSNTDTYVDSGSGATLISAENKRYFGTSTGITKSSLVNAISYSARTTNKETGIEIKDNIDKTLYYGDFVIIGNESGVDKLVVSYTFASVTADSLGISQGFDNQMTCEDESNKVNVFYAYYFDVASFAINGGQQLNEWQNEFDLLFNTLSPTDEFYPFKSTSKDVFFTSQNPDVLTIDQSGNIIIKSTGLVKIGVTSLLNTNNGLDFYIYVTNYINKDDVSIVYPNTSSSSTSIDETIIQLRADNMAMLYIRPDYSLTIDEATTISSDGVGRFQAVIFNLVKNSEVSATVTDEDEGKFNISINGQTIYITKGSSEPADGEYTIKIQPILSCKVNDATFTASVNKEIGDTKVDYKKGAIKIVNKTYDSTAIYSSIKIEDTLIVTSTDEKEASPVYRILGLDGKELQSNIKGASDDEDILFNVVISSSPLSLIDEENGYYNLSYSLSIAVNTRSQAFKDRYDTNIYGQYTFIAYASSNLSKSTSFTFVLGQTDIISVPIDNYTKLSEATGSMPSKSDKAYPGESGILQISVTPTDADFDAIIIENDPLNFADGHANAVFTLLARKSKVTGTDNLFESTTITGSQSANGLEIRLSDIINLYKNSAYEKYNGVIYIRYDFSSENVLDESVSRINVKFIKDGQSEPIATVSKDLTIKLQHFVGIELVGKTKNQENSNCYSAYTVARGLRYEIQINTYGFSKDNVKMVCENDNLAQIVKENDTYYLEISPSTLNHDNNTFDIYVEAEEGERKATSITKITIQDFVLNYNSDIENAKNPDIVERMGNGVINLQIGTQMTLAINLYDYIEYDSTNNEVVNIIESFLLSLAKKANWIAHTNLLENDDYSPDFSISSDKGKEYQVEEGEVVENYYFKSNGLNIIPVHTHKTAENYYYFTMETYYKASGTNYTVGSSSDSKISTQFVLNVYTSSSEESPIPVYNYEEFTSMYSDSHYILMKDIVFPADYTPISGNFASFDGNGCTIHYEGEYDFGSAEELGIFSSIEQDTVVKNLNINFMQVKSGSVLTPVSITTSAENYIFGALTASNNGIVTNCHVFATVRTATSINEAGGANYDGISDFVIKAPNASLNKNYIAGLIGNNSGYITNCSVKLDIQSTACIAGVVSSNNGKIAATAYKGGKLTGEGANQNTAGFVYLNSENAQIITSFVSGDAKDGQIYSTNSTLFSSQPSAGFAFINSGTIKDCYSDIAMNDVSARNAGFVYTNEGLIKNSFSLSIIKSNNTSSAGFAMENSGDLTNCYYLRDAKAQINTALAQVDNTFGITRLEIAEFANLDNFAEFSLTSVPNTKSVWFYSDDSSSNLFVEQKITFIMGVNKSEIITNYSTTISNKTLVTKRIELVSANIFTYSKRELDENNIEIDSETGVETYHYLDSTNAPNRGTLNNPILIASAKQMENLFLENSSATYVNTSNYRLISDIDYSDETTGIEGYSNLYKITFAGMLEGNGMQLSQIGLVSMEQLSSAGLFAQIGMSASKTGSVKNLVIAPREVAYSSSGSVGTLAGVLNNGYIYDISVSVAEGNNMTATGLNFVGGVIGRAINAFEMKDIYSNINASAGNNPSGDYSYEDKDIDYSKYSYAGSIAGYVGRGNVYNAFVSGVSSIMGGRAGFAYGGIGVNANVNYTFVTIQTSSTIRAYKYGGLVAGEVCGTLKFSSVDGTENQENIFTTTPRAAYAVGGIAGRLNGGKISNAVMNQSFKFIDEDNGKAIQNIGGLVGSVQSNGSAKSTIVDSIVYGDISTCTNLGGAVGNISSALTMDSVAVKSSKLMVAGEMADPSLGGLVATVSKDASSLVISNCYSVSQLSLKTYTSGVESFARASGFIANCQIASLSMRSCYTTCGILAEVYDIRQVEDLVSFENKGTTADANNCLKKVSFQQKVNTNSNIVDVYYLGSSSTGLDADGYTDYTKAFIPFTSKSKSVEIGLIINQYGTSSMQYTANSSGTAEKTFYGLFGSDYDYVDEATGKHFMLRYNATNKVFEAYDNLRKYILESGYNYDALPFDTANKAYYKQTVCNLLSLKEIELSSVKAEIYDGAGVNRNVEYYFNEDKAWYEVEVKQEEGKKYLSITAEGYTGKYAGRYNHDGSGFALVDENNEFEKDDNGNKTYFDLSKLYKFELLRRVAEGETTKLLEQQPIYTFAFDANDSSILNYIQQSPLDPIFEEIENDVIYDRDESGKLIEGGDGKYIVKEDKVYYCSAHIATEKWTSMSLYKDSDNNIYKAGYDESGKVVYENISDGTIEEGGELLSLIWNADSTGSRLTYLCIEDNLRWLNKK